MTKQEFMKSLKKELRSLPRREAEECLAFYSEMIDDKVEEGLTEAKAVAEIGDAKSIARERLAQTGETSRSKQKLGAGDKALLVLASPIWVPLLIVALALYFTFYAVMWALIIVLWAVESPFLVMSVISKGLFPACKRITVIMAGFTAQSVKYIKKIFTGKRGTDNE